MNVFESLETVLLHILSCSLDVSEVEIANHSVDIAHHAEVGEFSLKVWSEQVVNTGICEKFIDNINGFNVVKATDPVISWVDH